MLLVLDCDEVEIVIPFFAFLSGSELDKKRFREVTFLSLFEARSVESLKIDLRSCTLQNCKSLYSGLKSDSM